MSDKHDQRRDIGHTIDNFRIGRCLDKFKTENQNKRQNEKTSRSGAEETIIETNNQPNKDPQNQLTFKGMLRNGHLPPDLSLEKCI